MAKYNYTPYKWCTANNSNSKNLNFYKNGNISYIPYIRIHITNSFYNLAFRKSFSPEKLICFLYQTITMKPILFPFFSCLPGSSELNLMFKYKNYLASDDWCKDFFALLRTAHYLSSDLCLFSDFVFKGPSLFCFNYKLSNPCNEWNTNYKEI